MAKQGGIHKQRAQKVMSKSHDDERQLRENKEHRGKAKVSTFYSRHSVFFNLLLMTNSFLCVDREVTSHFKGGYMISIECSNYRTCKKEKKRKKYLSSIYVTCHENQWSLKIRISHL